MNSNQYTSLPHTNTHIGGGNQRGGTTFYNNSTEAPNNAQANTNRNYKGKKNNSKRPNYNNPPVQQISNNYNSHHLDFGCASLPHTQQTNTNGYSNTNNNTNNRYGNQYPQFNKFSTNAADLNNFGNNVPVPKPQKKNHKRRRGGSNNNYNGNSNFQETITERLNKSFKEMSGDNSFNDLSLSMPTSFSLDNIGGCINIKNSPKMPNSRSFHTKSPSNRLHKLTDVIQEVTENFSSNNIDSGVDSNSYCSMPASDSHKSYTPLTSDLLSSIECDESQSSKNSSSISSPDSQKNGYETALSQMVTASEGELSFGYESSNHISNLTIEASFTNSIDHAVLESYLQRVSEEELRAQRSSEYNTIKTCQEIESSFESSENSSITQEKTEKEITVASEESEKSEEAVVEPEVEAIVEPEVEVETVVEPEVEIEATAEPEVETEAIVEPEVETEVTVEPEVETEAIVEPVVEENTIKSPVPEIIITMTPDCVERSEEYDDEDKTPVPCVDEEISSVSVKLEEIALEEVVEEEEEDNKLVTNLISQSTVEVEEQMSEEMLNSLKFAEQEVNDLVNKIVIDVISQAIHVPAEPTLETIEKSEPVITDYDSTNFMSLEQEINKLKEEEEQNVKESNNIENLEISYIDNEVTDENSSMEIIEKPETNKADEKLQTEAILRKTDRMLSKSSSSFKLDNMPMRKEPPVDCFSCTIS